MCGLVGLAGEVSSTMRSKFKDFLDVCQVRGRDSTGVIHVGTEDQEYSFLKQVGTPVNLYDTNAYEDLVERTPSVALIGHCRAKTVGEASRRNAHPFDFPSRKLIGVHNGTLRNQHTLPTYKHGRTDSEAMYEHLADVGPQDTFSKLKGAWACVWWDGEEKTLNFIRNSERTLYITFTKDCRTLLWASEIWMFFAMSRQVGIDLWEGTDQTAKFTLLPENNLFSFRLHPEQKGDGKSLTLRPIKIINPAEEKKSTTVHRGTYTNNFGDGTWINPTTGKRMKWCNELKKSVNVEDDEDEPLALTPPKGGEVVNPFPHLVKSSSESEKALSADEKTPFPISNVSFLQNSAITPTPSQPSNSTKKSLKVTLSLPVMSSKISVQTSNDEKSKSFERQSGGCEPLQSEARAAITKLTSGVSVRVVAGQEYITDNTTGVEYSRTDFEANTLGCCTFCKTKVSTLSNVDNFLNKNSFICKPCLTPNMDGVV